MLNTINEMTSNAWATRPNDDQFSSLTKLHEARKADWERSREEIIRVDDLELIAPVPETASDLHKLSVQSPDFDHPHAPTHWAFGQLAQLAKAPAGYLRTLPSQIVADAMSYGLRFLRRSDQIKVFVNDDDLKAATGPDYGRVPDHEVVEAIIDAFDDGLGNWSIAADYMGARSTDRSLNVFLQDTGRPIVIGKAPDGTDDVLHRGIMFRNSEVGSSAIRAEAFLFRNYCLNGLIFGMRDFEAVSIRHSKNAPHRWVNQMKPAIEAFAHGSDTKLINAIENAKVNVVAKDDDAAVKWLQDRGLTARASRNAMERHLAEEHRPARSSWDMIQAITAAARSHEHSDDRIEAEKVAGRIFEKVAS